MGLMHYTVQQSHALSCIDFILIKDAFVYELTYILERFNNDKILITGSFP